MYYWILDENIVVVPFTDLSQQCPLMNPYRHQVWNKTDVGKFVPRSLYVCTKISRNDLIGNEWFCLSRI